MSYVDPQTSTDHAVLISGEWGSGKTWFINQFLELKMKEDENFKFFNISLYGLNSLDDIASEYFRQAHPVLSSRGMIIGKALGKALAKGLLKLDLDGDKKEDFQVKLEDLDGVITKKDFEADKRLLVFDDVERCAIDIIELLGYINHFVEIQGYKAILLANENKLQERCDNSNNKDYGTYKEIKEKLIGKVFLVTPEAEKAIETFVEGIICETTKSICKESLENIIAIYKEAGYLNLRMMKRALWGFEMLVQEIVKKDEAVLSKSDFNKHFLLLYLIYIIESKYNLKEEDLGPISRVLYAVKPDDGLKKVFDDLNKYNTIVNATDPLLGNKVWDNLIFSNAPLDVDALIESIGNTKYFYSESTPAWRKLWNLYELDDEQFDGAKATVVREFNTGQFEYPQVLLHVFGILLRLSNVKMIEMQRKELVEKAKENVDIMFEQDQLYTETAFKSYWDYHGGHESWASLGYQSNDSKEFAEVLEYYDKIKEKAKQKFLKDSSKELVSSMKQNPHQFLVSIVHNNHGERSYYDQPILMYVDPGEFVCNFSSLPNKQKSEIISAISLRYSDVFARDLIVEAEWLKNVRDLMVEEAKKWKGKVSHLHFERMLEQALAPSIKTLEKLIAEQKGKEGEVN